MSHTFPGYSPPPLKQKSSYQLGSKSEQVPRYLLTFMCWYHFEYHIKCSKCWPFAATHLLRRRIMDSLTRSSWPGRFLMPSNVCISFRTLSITHSSVFLVNHNNSRISTQQWISRNLFTFRPMLIGTFFFNWGWGIPRKILWHRVWDTRYIYIYVCMYMRSPFIVKSRCKSTWDTCIYKLLASWELLKKIK